MKNFLQYIQQNFQTFLRIYFLNNCLFFIGKHLGVFDDYNTILTALIGGLVWVLLFSIFQWYGLYDPEARI